MLFVVSEFISPSFLSLRRILFSLLWIGVAGSLLSIVKQPEDSMRFSILSVYCL